MEWWAGGREVEMGHQRAVPAIMESSTRRRGRGQKQGPGWRFVLELASSGLADRVNGEIWGTESRMNPSYVFKKSAYLLDLYTKIYLGKMVLCLAGRGKRIEVLMEKGQSCVDNH